MIGPRLRCLILCRGISIALAIAAATSAVLRVPIASLAQAQEPAHRLEINLAPQAPWACSEITAGRDNALTLTLANTGAEPVTDIQLSAPDAPARWIVALEPAEIAVLEPGSSRAVVLTLRPHAMARRDSRRSLTVVASSAESQFAGFVCVDVRLGALRLWSTVGLGVAVVALFSAIYVHHEKRSS